MIRELGSVTGSPREGGGLLSHARPDDFCNCVQRTDASSNGASSRPKQATCFAFPRVAYSFRSTLCEEASRVSPTSSKAGPSFLGDARANTRVEGTELKVAERAPRSRVLIAFALVQTSVPKH